MCGPVPTSTPAHTQAHITKGCATVKPVCMRDFTTTFSIKMFVSGCEASSSVLCEGMILICFHKCHTYLDTEMPLHSQSAVTFLIQQLEPSY